MPLEDEAQQLARELFETRSKLRASGRTLHDHVGPLLSAAGIRLDLIRADYPQTASAVLEALRALEEAMERIRALSRDLNPPPAAHMGLRKALASIVAEREKGFRGEIRFSYNSTAALPDDAVAAIYETVSAVMERAASDRSATCIALSVRGARNLIVTMESNGRAGWSRPILASQQRRLRPAGIILDTPTKEGTIVFIRYAPRRPARG